MGELNVSLVAVDRKIWSGTATMVVAKTLEGEIGILPRHEPVLALLANSPVRITTSEGKVIQAAVHGGFFSVDSDNVAILAGSDCMDGWSHDNDGVQNVACLVGGRAGTGTPHITRMTFAVPGTALFWPFTDSSRARVFVHAVTVSPCRLMLSITSVWKFHSKMQSYLLAL